MPNGKPSLVRQRRPHQIPTALVAGLLGLTLCLLKIRTFFAYWYEPFLQVYSLVAAGYVFSRVLLSMFYREPADVGIKPAVSVVIAAKNEEAHVAETVRRCFQSGYPADKLEVLVVDDGSTDRTWEALQSVVPDYPGLKLFKFETNKGKRHAMALGAEEAKGEILVYVDSDSYLEPDGISKIVQPFIDSRVGAVSGHVLVAVEPDNFISKMESVRYYVSHRVMKAAESLFGAVTCCPGAFSAYRRETVMRILPAWLNQTFLGEPATFGDDRSLTNFVLRTHRVVFHDGARCATYVPGTWSKFFRQQLRWKKSWSRETTVAVRQMYRLPFAAAAAYYVGVMLTLLSPIIALRALIFLFVFGSKACLPYLAGVFLVYLFFCLLYLYHTGEKHWYYGLAFAALYITVLSFQNYYAIATMRRNYWGTR